MAWQAEADDRCPGCGTQSWQDGDYVPVRITCMTCAALAQKRGEVFNHKVSNPGVHVVLNRKG